MGRYSIFYIVLFFFSSCEKDYIVKNGMKPVYYSFDDFSELRSANPIPFGSLGKIVTSGKYIFINEIGKGIHVIDNSEPATPKQAFFWHIPGNSEFTIYTNVLYADNGKHLLTIDISDFSRIALLKVIKNKYNPEVLELYPKNYHGFFECYNGAAGILKGWEKGEIINPHCRTN